MSIDPFGSNDYIILAQLYYSEGDTPKAIENYKKAKEFIQQDASSDNSELLESIDATIAAMEQEAGS